MCQIAQAIIIYIYNFVFVVRIIHYHKYPRIFKDLSSPVEKFGQARFEDKTHFKVCLVDSKNSDQWTDS
jgi:hypothetical protein